MGLLSSIGKVVNIASSVAGIAGGFKKQKGPGDALKSTVKAGSKVGLHPLASIGSNTGYTDTGNSLIAAARAGNELGDAITDIEDRRRAGALEKDQRARQKRLDDAQIAAAEADIAEARSRTILNLTNVKRQLNGPMVPGGNGALGGLEQVLAEGPKRDTKIEEIRDLPLLVQSTVDGKTAYVPNPDLAEMGVGEAAMAALILAPQYGYQYLKEFIADNFSEERARRNLKRGNDRGTPFLDRVLSGDNYRKIQKYRKGP